MLDDRKMDRATLASDLVSPIRFVDELISGDQEITPEIAEDLHRVLGMEIGWWLTRERFYRETKVRLEVERLKQTKQSRDK